MSAPSPTPAGRVTAITSTGFTVTLTAVPTTTSTVDLDTRPMSGVAAWTTQATAAFPAAASTLAATGLTADTALEWRLKSYVGGAPLLSDTADGTHGVVTPSTSPWATIRTTVGNALTGAGVVGLYYGNAPLDSHDPLTAVVRQGDDSVVMRGNNILTRLYPIEVEIRIRLDSATGAQHFTNTATWQRQLVSLFNDRDAGDYPSIVGLEVIRVETRDTDGAARGKGEGYTNEARSTLTVQFFVNEAR